MVEKDVKRMRVIAEGVRGTCVAPTLILFSAPTMPENLPTSLPVYPVMYNYKWSQILCTSLLKEVEPVSPSYEFGLSLTVFN